MEAEIVAQYRRNDGGNRGERGMETDEKLPRTFQLLLKLKRNHFGKQFSVELKMS
jgi:hypothetical protein